MKRCSRQSRLAIALVALFGMLFMQCAVAGYMCPSMKLMGSGASAMSNAMNQSMAGCKGMDNEQPGLCHAHDQAGNQTLDKPELPHVQPFVATGSVLVWDSIEIADRPSALLSEFFLLTRIAAPPLSIRNCCFRI